MRIYVAGPYSDPMLAVRLANVEEAMRIGVGILAKGHYPYIPHLTHFFDRWCAGLPMGPPPYDVYIQWGLSFVDVCDALFAIARSPGTDREIKHAIGLSLPIYTDLSEIPPAVGTLMK